MIVVVLIVAIATFFLVNLMPGDPVYIVAGSDEIDQKQYDVIFHELNLDKSVFERFGIWVWNALHLDFGKSYIYSMPVWDVIGQRIPYTIYLSLLTMLISVPIGVVLGVIAAVNRKKWPDTVITLISNIISSLPQFFVGLVLLYVFCLKLKLLPSLGFDWSWKVGYGTHIKTLILPLTCLCLGSIASFARQARSSMLEVIRQDYIRTAKSQGLPPKKVYLKHMLRNGLIPVITILGQRLGLLIGGAMYVETIFSIPGMGVLIKTCIQRKDIPTIQAVVLMTTLVLCLAYIITDVLYVVVDPCVSLTNDAD